MSRPRILLDCDGVLANFTGAAVNTMNRLWPGTNHPPGIQPVEWDFGDLIPYAENNGSDYNKLRFWEAMNDVGVARNLEPLPHAEELVLELSKLGELWCVTSPMESSPTWCYERLQWLRAHLGVDKHRVVFASDKSAVDGVVLIDDRALNLVRWEAAMAPPPWYDLPARHGVLWEQPYSGSWGGDSVRTVADAVLVVESVLRAL